MATSCTSSTASARWPRVGGIAGVLLAAGYLGARRDTVALQAGVIFGAIGFAVMNLMAVVQNSIHILTRRGVPQHADPQMIDWSHPHFGRVFGLGGLLFAGAILALNLHSSPLPPEPDLGPLAGLWAGAVAIRMLLPPLQ